MKRKGVSPLIAAVLLIVFTVAISTIVVNWLRDYTTETTSSVGETSREVIDCAKENLKMTNAYITVNTTADADDVIKATLKNTGHVDFTISSAYVYNTVGDYCDMTPVDTTVVPGAVKNLENATGCSIFESTGDFSRVEVTTTCGVSTDFASGDNPTMTSVV